jgi:alkanesulfonate monooxygenase SsuD/methylene tetrahydromethanopterin reductase-like flavin-dependent oxidoreductase (luciferase family)
MTSPALSLTQGQATTDPGRRLKFNMFMCGNDGYLPYMDETRKSNFVDLPGAEFSQPLLAQGQMDRYLTTMASGERLGFDGLMVMEQRAPGFQPSAMIVCSALIQMTKGIEVIAAGPVMNNYLTPLRVAEEIAMLDCMSGGRFQVGFPLGIGSTYHQTGANPSEARARHLEGLDLIEQALTRPGPFEFRGDFFHHPIVNVFPRPLRMPPVWTPGAGSRETIDLAARRRYTYMAILNPRASRLRNCELFHQLAEEEYGYTPTPDQTAAVVYIHVAESDAQARKEAEPHLMWINQNIMRSAMHDFFPPGYTSVASMKAMLSGGYRSKPPSELTYREMIDEGMAIVGSPDTVVAGLEELSEELGAGQVVMMADAGSMPEWMSAKNTMMFAQEVMPHFRPPGGRPAWAEAHRPGFETQAEFGARRPDPPRPALARIAGEGVVDVHTAHVDDLRHTVHE